MSAPSRNDTLSEERWMTCSHRFASWFGPVLKCARCGATTMVSMDAKESKAIFPPGRYEEPNNVS